MLPSVEKIVDKLIELSENGKKAVCLEFGSYPGLLFYARDHKQEIENRALKKCEGFVIYRGSFRNGNRGFFYCPGSYGRNWYPVAEKTVNFPMAEI